MGIVRRTVARIVKAAQNLVSVSSYGYGWWPGGWWGSIQESFTGAWQRNITADPETSILAFSAVFACVTGIASDIAKNRLKLSQDIDGIWEEITSGSPFLTVLRKPNHYQTRIKFLEQWIVSKLLWGNAYILKQRDLRGMVSAMYVLCPQRVTVLVAENGDVYYELKADYLSGVEDVVTVPASEIIHDMMVSLWHPLVGVSPLFACSLSTTMGNRIQNNATKFFTNMSRPGGVLTAPGAISDVTAARLKAAFEANYGGDNLGKIAVLGDGLKFDPMSFSAEAMQQIEQLQWTVEDVARAFHYPLFKLGGTVPAYATSLEPLTMMYFTDCLQSLVESLELCLDEGLSLPTGFHTELDIDNLLRMDTAALYDSNTKAVGGGWMAPDEARYRANFGRVPGGDSPYLQQQNYSLAALAKRDATANPFAAGTSAPSPPALPAAKEVRLIEAETLSLDATEMTADSILEEFIPV